MGASDVEDLKERLWAIEQQHSETSKLVAVLANEMKGIKWLLCLILGTIIVGIIGAMVTAWVQIPRSIQALPGHTEAPK